MIPNGADRGGQAVAEGPHFSVEEPVPHWFPPYPPEPLRLWNPIEEP